MVPGVNPPSMGATNTAANVRLVGGHACLDFVNTVDSRLDGLGPDLLRSFSDLAAWAEHARVLDQATAARFESAANASPQEAEQALERAKLLREALYAILLAEAGGQPPGPHDVALLDAAHARACPERHLAGSSEGVIWTWRQNRHLDAIAHRLTLGAAEFLLARPKRRAVRECTGPNCGWLFLDTSRGGRRRWCADETCGVLNRVRRFRNRGAMPPTEGG